MREISAPRRLQWTRTNYGSMFWQFHCDWKPVGCELAVDDGWVEDPLRIMVRPECWSHPADTRSLADRATLTWDVRPPAYARGA